MANKKKKPVAAASRNSNKSQRKAVSPARRKPTAAPKTLKLAAEKRLSMDDYAKKLLPWQVKVLTSIRAAFKSGAPEATETVKWAQPVWEHHGPVAYLRGFSKHVNFGFWRGAELTAREGLLEGDGSRMRHLKLAEGQPVPASEIAALARVAVALNVKHGDPTKR